MNVVIKVNDEVKEKMIEYYKDKIRDKKIPYAVFQAQDEDTVITLYESGKCMFQGTSADVDAAIWGVALENTKEKKDEKEKNDLKYYNCSSVGSDEVGTGDYFGPIVVTATYVNKENVDFLLELGVKDSKKMSDSEIISVVPEIIKKIPYNTFILTNKQYNDIYNSDMNMNKMKAILHNKVLSGLTNKEKYPCDYIVVDQFENPRSYYAHLKDASFKVYNITFLTKAEDQCLSVACASLISRYIFLNEIKKMSEELKLEIPKGAGDKVDEVAKVIVQKYGMDKLYNVAKMNFKNTEKVKKS